MRSNILRQFVPKLLDSDILTQIISLRKIIEISSLLDYKEITDGFYKLNMNRLVIEIETVLQNKTCADITIF